jgi:hypothetical protein
MGHTQHTIGYAVLTSQLARIHSEDGFASNNHSRVLPPSFDIEVGFIPSLLY